MLYPKNASPTLSDSLFQQPDNAYRGTPFWAWNCKLDADMLCRQIDILREMGMGGFHMHSRSGMGTPYLSDEFMGVVKACVEKARDNDMLAWLYDEDRWPSGAAGGIVTKDVRYRSRYLLFTTRPYGAANLSAEMDSLARGGRTEQGHLLAKYAVTLDENGCLSTYRQLAEGEAAPQGTTLWYAYLEHTPDSPWYNNQAYLDTLSPEAVRRFIEVTYDRYLESVGKDFGGVVPAIFTDEPQFCRKQAFGFANATDDVTIPWTDDFDDTFQTTYATSMIAHLPEVFWELPAGRVSVHRYHYHDHIAERFAAAFADQCGQWCEEHNLMLTGHMMQEPSLNSQTCSLGEAMRSYRSFQLPGIDLLCDRHEYTTAKQAQSAANQYGRPGVLSELYGVTGWQFDFRGHKLQGDWQAALGITVRVPHLSWVSMAGEAKRDYPASINYQSPWYREYPFIEDHFARLNTALTRGTPVVRIGVVHPVESYWLHFGPDEQTHAIREEMDAHFQNITHWLLNNLLDFDYLSESLLPEQCAEGGSPLRVGQMAYDAVLVPDCETLRSTTVERLEAFALAGGKLIFAGRVPTLVDALPSDRVQKMAARASVIPFTKVDILSALEPLRMLDVRNAKGIRPETLLAQLRQDGVDRWLFLCNGAHPRNPDIMPEEKLTLRVPGLWQPTLYDTITGDIRATPGTQVGGMTVLSLGWHGHDSLLLRLTPGVAAPAHLPNAQTLADGHRFHGVVSVTLSEPNVLLLDQAMYAMDDGEWQPRAEILWIDSAFRKATGLTQRNGHLPQPWVLPEDTEFKHHLHLRFPIRCEIDVAAPKLALENAALAQITLNGQHVASKPDGWFVDEAIETVPLPQLRAGENMLEITLPIGNRTGAEWCYLLGDFGVFVHGDTAEITPPVRALGFGDWTRQGLPFYAGNVTYHLPLETKGGFTVEVPHYRSPLLVAALDGERVDRIVYAPYRLHVDAEPGMHSLDLTAYGNRFNAFGALHNCDNGLMWHGPDAWRSTGARWCDEYRLRETGILVSPCIYPDQE